MPNWTKHKSFIINGGQIVAIVTLLIGFATTYWQSKTNEGKIQDNSSWMVEAIKKQSDCIVDLKIKEAVLEQEIKDLK